MSVRLHWRELAAVLVLWACGGEPEAQATSHALVGGSLDTADPAAVALVHRLPAGHAPAKMAFCSGVLIESGVVLTAAHCVAEEHEAPFDAFFGATLAAGGDIFPVQSVAVHPRYDAATHAFDVAALRLAFRVPVTPLSIPADDSLLVTPGSSVRAIGFGVDESESSFPDQKRSGRMLVTESAADRFDTAPSPAMTCTADSGGPVLAAARSGEEQLLGLTLFGDPGCRVIAHNLRLAPLLSSFIAPFVAQRSKPDFGCSSARRPASGAVGLPLLATVALRRWRRRRRSG